MSENEWSQEEDKASEPYGCTHYKRGCMLFCDRCEEYFSCRFCHDQIKNASSLPPKEQHPFDRFAVSLIKCLSCNTIQKVIHYNHINRFKINAVNVN